MMKLIKRANAGLWRPLLLCMALVLLCPVLSACETRVEKGVELRDLCWAVSTPLPEAEDFATFLPKGYSIRFAKRYSFLELKTHTVELIVTDDRGRESTHKAHLTLVIDEEPPVLSGVTDRLVYLGDSISYFSGVSAEDNCDGGVTLTVNKDGVDLRAVGVYPVYYTATDAAGNCVTYRATVTVAEEEITEEMLWAALDPVIDEMIYGSMTREQMAREIYDYVYYHVSYVGTSDKSNWVRAAYEGLTTGQGDCYTYFALSRAFFLRLGIPTLDVVRDPVLAAKADERHFWNLVNVGTEETPRWYHFDACRIKDYPDPWGCLMTDEQLDECTADKVSANGTADYFYVYDREAYPATATQKINFGY